MSSAGEDPPVVAGSLFGLRLWNVSSYRGEFRLASATASHRWDPEDPGPAICRKERHPAPAMECSCGFYCFHPDLDSMNRVQMFANRSPRLNVAGIVRLWGRTEVHPTGMRSEFAVPDSLFLPGGAGPAMQMMYGELAEKYGAGIWSGPTPELLRRMEAEKPGLSRKVVEDMVGDLPAPPRRRSTGPYLPKRYRLLPLGPERRAAATDSSSGHPLTPHGFWPSNSEPRLGMIRDRNADGLQVIRLSSTRRLSRRFTTARAAPGTELRLSRNVEPGGESGSIRVESIGDVKIGVIPAKYARDILAADPSLAGTRAWLLCNWKRAGSKPGSPPERVNILLAEPGAWHPRFPGPHSED